ncbi:MAG: META domain-containing protein [Dermatophilaceae bacterium]|nr:META domain-containing protein [Intrasporangiaceae bacterium]
MNGTWVPESIVSRNERRHADLDAASVLTLADGRATGTGGVNRFTAGFEATDDGRISFVPVVSTRMAGPDEAMAQEASFFGALERAARFDVSEERLALRDRSANTVLVLARGGDCGG